MCSTDPHQVFCTTSYFEKQQSLMELYRSVLQRRPILAMLEPDRSQEGGLRQIDVERLITKQRFEQVFGDGSERLPLSTL
jgi:hypothetical protein